MKHRLVLFPFLALPVVGLAHPQMPASSAPYKAIDVAFKGAGGPTIAGTLTIPSTPVAAVLLLPGSGPADRNASIGDHRPFAVAAHYLARHGIASLRTDSRGVGKSFGSYYECTGETLAGDAVAAINFLRGRAETHDIPLGVVGHSLGGTVAVMASAQSQSIAFVVLLSSPGRPDVENAGDRLAAQLRGSGTAAAEIEDVLSRLRKVTANPDAPTLKADLRALTKIATTGLVPPDRLDAVVDEQVTTMRSPWGRYFGALDPRPTLARVRCPVLAIGGSLDRVVPAEANLRQIHGVLIGAGNPDATVIEMQGINHWLQDARTGSPAEIPELKNAISPRVLALVAGWVRAHTVELP